MILAIQEISEKDWNEWIRFFGNLENESKLYAALLTDGYLQVGTVKNRYIERVDTPYSVILAARQGKEVIGAAIIHCQSSPFSHCAQVSIGILREWRGRGYGHLLLDAAEKQAKQRNIQRLELAVPAMNRPALLLFGIQGYHVEGTRKASILVDGKVKDEFYMAKFLK